MKTRRGLIVCFTALCFAAAYGQTEDVPGGLEWHAIPEIKAKLLVPAGWHFSSLSSSASKLKVYRVTKQEPTTNGDVETGLLLSVELHAEYSSAAGHAQEFVRTQLATGTVVQPLFEEDFGPMKAYGGVAATTRDGRSYTVAHNVVVNPTTKTIYKFKFQAPTSEWDAAWQTGQWLIGRFKLDDEV